MLMNLGTEEMAQKTHGFSCDHFFLKQTTRKKTIFFGGGGAQNVGGGGVRRPLKR